MKTLGEAAMDLPWLMPSVASMMTLARTSLLSGWPHLRSDPAVVLLAAHLCQTPSDAHDVTVLEAILQHQANFNVGFVDWAHPGPAAVRRVCYRQAILATELAERVGCDARQAWSAGFLAPLGWLALSAVAPATVSESLASLGKNTDTHGWQRQLWGYDHPALARRLCRAWRLPDWLTTILSHVGMRSEIAVRLGADARLFQVVQLAILLLQERERGLGLTIHADLGELLRSVRLTANEAECSTIAALQAEPPAQAWDTPAQHPLLPDLLRLSLENRRQNDGAWIERLQQELDHLQEAMVQQTEAEKGRLNSMKLSALAEFAAGAGHEINNPLAVISGQAQYVLKQMDWLNVPAEEIENITEYMDNVRSKVTPSLQKIIGQTQRIHGILKELMQFARPLPPEPRELSAGELVREVVASLQGLATEHEVKLSFPEVEIEALLQVDPKQASIALSGLLRNAIEAAPAGGWARIRIEPRGQGLLAFIVEDNGAGPPPSAIEHLFDPFYSGRSAGRGRGMGLPTAWRLARQNGGDVAFDGVNAGTTRFVLTLKLISPAERTTHLTLARSA